jgi:hypothetical protein
MQYVFETLIMLGIFLNKICCFVCVVCLQPYLELKLQPLKL